MLRSLALRDAELSIVLTDDATIHALNRTYRKQDRPTDVLAFAMREGPRARADDSLLGDIVVSLETAARQADEGGRTLAAEVRMLVAHGLLHLLGHDHRNHAEERRMTARTGALVAAARAVNKVGQTTQPRRWLPG